jgi:hypothetical protein
MTDLAKAYCGIGKVPKGYHRASMKEAAEKGQVRYFGLYKIDQKLVDSVKREPLTGKNVLLKKWAGLNGRIKKLEGDIRYKKDPKDKENAKVLLAKAKLEYNKIVKKLNPEGSKEQSKDIIYDPEGLKALSKDLTYDPEEEKDDPYDDYREHKIQKRISKQKIKNQLINEKDDPYDDYREHKEHKRYADFMRQQEEEETQRYDDYDEYYEHAKNNPKPLKITFPKNIAGKKFVDLDQKDMIKLIQFSNNQTGLTRSQSEQIKQIFMNPTPETREEIRKAYNIMNGQSPEMNKPNRNKPIRFEDLSKEERIKTVELYNILGKTKPTAKDKLLIGKISKAEKDRIQKLIFELTAEGALALKATYNEIYKN